MGLSSTPSIPRYSIKQGRLHRASQASSKRDQENMKTYEIICLDRDNKLNKVAEISEKTQEKARLAGVRFAKLMGLRFNLAKKINR